MRDHRRELGISQRGGGADEAGDQEGQDHARPGEAGAGADQRQDAGADDRADAERHEMRPAERAMELVRGVGGRRGDGLERPEEGVRHAPR